MPLCPGDRLDTYQIVAPLGAGGMGEVWLARDLRLDRRVAVKVLPPHLTDDADRVARFRHEARVASALNHPNVCTIYALDTAEDGRLFIVMEYIDGSTLRDRLAGDPLPIRHAVEIAEQIASALAAAHAAGVIHRDVKPENVMLRPDGLVKVLDFGLAKLDPAVAFNGAQSTRTALSTHGDIVMGTSIYMSPEQARGEPLDARTDIFSLGAVLYEMVTGRQAFVGNSTAVVYDGILNRMPLPAMNLNPQVRPGLQDIINKALEKSRDLRYQFASELRTDLIRFGRDTDWDGGAVRQTDTAWLTRRSPGRPRQAAIILALLLAGLLGSVAVGWRRWPSLFQRSHLQEVQLTTNSSENPVTASAISPDGRYMVYADQVGIHLRLSETGETHTIGAPDFGNINRVAWFPDGSKLVVSGAGTTDGALSAIWSVSIIGGIPRRLRDDGLEASVSPDGSEIAFVDSKRSHVWVMGANGEDPHPMVTSGGADSFYLPGYPATIGARLVYARARTFADASGAWKQELSVEWRDRAGQSGAVLSDPGLRGGAFLPDGRFLYSLVADPVLNREASLWQINVDAQRAVTRGTPRRIRDWAGSVSLSTFSVTADGKRIALLKGSPQKDVYIADLTPDGAPINPRRFTLDDSTDFATNWTPDSKALFFTSDRNGSFDIFRQALDQRTPEVVVGGADDESGPTAVSADGAWFYYLVEPKGWRLTSTHQVRVMRTAAAGGARQQVSAVSQFKWALCARSSPTCVLIEHDTKHMVIYALDPEHGKGARITSTELGVGRFYQADLSPDGSRVAIKMPVEQRIRILSLQGEPPRDVTITGWPLDLAVFFWSADGTGWYVSSTSPTNATAGSSLLRVDLNGRISVVSHQNVSDPMTAIPSPDGKHLALTQTSIVSNVWMLTGY